MSDRLNRTAERASDRFREAGAPILADVLAMVVAGLTPSPATADAAMRQAEDLALPVARACAMAVAWPMLDLAEAASEAATDAGTAELLKDVTLAVAATVADPLAPRLPDETATVTQVHTAFNAGRVPRRRAIESAIAKARAVSDEWDDPVGHAVQLVIARLLLSLAGPTDRDMTTSDLDILIGLLTDTASNLKRVAAVASARPRPPA